MKTRIKENCKDLKTFFFLQRNKLISSFHFSCTGFPGTHKWSEGAWFFSPPLCCYPGSEHVGICGVLPRSQQDLLHSCTAPVASWASPSSLVESTYTIRLCAVWVCVRLTSRECVSPLRWRIWRSSCCSLTLCWWRCSRSPACKSGLSSFTSSPTRWRRPGR